MIKIIVVFRGGENTTQHYKVFVVHVIDYRCGIFASTCIVNINEIQLYKI